MQRTPPLQQEVSANKFYPPRITPGANLSRTPLITQTLGETACSKTAIIITAQAGQGKSTLAAQFLYHYKLRFAWYQIGPEDADPILFLSALKDNLQQKLPGFEPSHFSHIMEQSELGPSDLIRCANVLLSDLDHHLVGNFYLVLDDLHFCEEAQILNRLLSHLVDSSPPHLHFILISRSPLNLTAKKLCYGTDVCTLNNQALSLTLQDVERLFREVLNRPISHEDAERIRDQTYGWIMGILLAAHAGKRQDTALGSAGKVLRLPADLSAGQIPNYFRNEILTHIPEELHPALIRLSLLDEIPIGLAATICGHEDIGAILTDLVEDNFFLYPLDEQQTVFRFHHLFQEFLQSQAQTHLDQRQRDALYATAATYYLEHSALEQALLCYQRGNDLPALEEILRREGLNMIARNRTITLLTLLEAIPKKQLLNFAWLTLLTAMLYADYYPKKTLPMLESARNRFIITEDETGELLALAHLIYFHFVISGLYHTGALLLPRADELFRRLQDVLPIQAQIMVSRNIGAGYCFFVSQMEPARTYAHKSRELATANDLRNSIASSRFVCGYIASLTDNHRACLQEIEASNLLLNDPLVGMSNRLTLKILHLNYLSKTGDFINCSHHQRLLLSSVDNQIVEQTVAAPYLYIWGCAGLIATGQAKEAEQLLKRGRTITATAETAHMRSQFLQWEGYIRALSGDTDGIEGIVSEALTLRKVAGGPFYSTLCKMICGATLARSERPEEAEELLSTALREAGRLPSQYLVAAALFHRAGVHLQLQQEQAMYDDLEAGLRALQDNNYTSFWSWEPQSMQTLLHKAFTKGILPDFTARLARKRLNIFFAPKGKVQPILELKVIGSFRLKIREKTILRAEELTASQRQLMALLLASEKQKIHQEQLQLALWPESRPETTRAKMDTFLMRFRKVLAAALPGPANNYLHLNKGFLCLHNCRIDGEEFSKKAQRGLDLAQNEKFWQAGNAFFEALGFWEGVTSEGSDLFRGETSGYYDQLRLLLSKVGSTYGIILAESNHDDNAIEVLERIIMINRMDDQLITLLYSLYVRSGKMLKAQELLSQYRQTLHDLEYSQEEIEELLFALATSAS